MWSSLGICLSLLANVVHSRSTSNGYLYFFDGQTHTGPDSREAVTADTVRLIAARRLGLEQFHSVGTVNTASIAAVNQYAPMVSMLETNKQESKQFITILLTNSDESIKDQAISHFDHRIPVIDLPAHTKSAKLWTALMTQMKSITSSRETTHESSIVDIWNSKLAPYDNLNTAIESYRQSGRSVLVFYTPSITTSPFSYGEYNIPSPSQHLKVPRKEVLSTLKDDTDLINDTTDPSSSHALKQSKGIIPIRGFLPQCFPSLSQCQSQTNNCSSHGSCHLAYTQHSPSSSNSERGSHCYSCQCKASYDDKRHKTTSWAGPACQKKDVSEAFWLLAGGSLVLIMLISWAIGTIWSMGDEDLPSVIGAGVSGVHRK